ncbi:Crp/Fnr family transcriptional regulator [Haematobacter sp.]|uniref:Crp/Fnr family transcriptional regulator n=1 Tax=Haematobacter sp. TaxID=2953762 RepID=UPI0028A5C494|nr:Crp/Fnr family transcriptional regulator [Haematobacter sp.]
MNAFLYDGFTMEKLARQQIVEVLSSRGWLSSQSESFRNDVFNLGVSQYFSAGSVIYRVGDAPGGVYGVVSGGLLASLSVPDEVPRPMQFGTPGGWVGIMPFFDGGERRATLQAATSCLLFHLPLNAMEAMVAKNPEAIRAFGQIATANLQSMVELLHILMLPNAERRIAATLFRAARSKMVELPLTQANLAAMANTSTRQVSASLREFAEAGLVRTSYRAIRILDLDRLGVLAATEHDHD